MNEETLENMFYKERRNIMKVVHRPNPSGRTKSKIDFFEDDEVVLIDTDLTSADTKYHFIMPTLSFTVLHNPFISYSELTALFKVAMIKRKEIIERVNAYKNYILRERREMGMNEEG
jgi:hypothetical protein